MNGLEISEISYKTLFNESSDFRFDAEYHKKENIRKDNVLNKKGYSEIGEFAYVTDGIHTSIDYSEDSGINLFSATTPRENYFDLSRGAYISEKAHKANPRTSLQENDIIISTVGTIGNCAVVNKDVLPANSDRHVGIIRVKNDTFYPRFVSTFLLTKYGRFQTLRESTGNVQLNLFLYKIRELKIPNVSKEFQEKIENLVIDSDIKIKTSKEKYSKAENMLLSELGLKDFHPSSENVSIKTLQESFLKTGRLDSEYYQVKYDRLFERLSKIKCAKLSNLVTIKKSIEPGSEYYEDKGIPFVRVQDLTKFGLGDTSIYLSKDKFGDCIRPKKNTILLSKDGTVGIAYKMDQNADVITSSAILHLNVKDNCVLPDYLTLALNSIVVKMQAEKDAGGSIIKHWKKGEIENVIVPILSKEKQEEIKGLLMESMRLRKESQLILEKAVRAVEMAIECGEEKALLYLSS